MTHLAKSEINISDKQVAKQLEILSVKIQEGIEKAYQVIKEAEQVKQEIELQKSDFNSNLEKSLSVGKQIEHWEEVLNKVAEIADKETIQRLEQEIESASNQINEVQLQVRHTDNIFDAFMNELQKRLVEVSQLQIQVERDKKMVQDLAKETDEKYQQILQMFSQISKKQEFELPQKSPVINADSTGNTVEDLYSELDFHIELDK